MMLPLFDLPRPATFEAEAPKHAIPHSVQPCIAPVIGVIAA